MLDWEVISPSPISEQAYAKSIGVLAVSTRRSVTTRSQKTLLPIRQWKLSTFYMRIASVKATH